MAAPTPPRVVPTLTEVVRPATRSRAGDMLSHEQLVHRVLQRVDLSIDQRLREAIARVVLDQTRQLAPALRAEIEQVVITTVTEALAEELGPDRPGPQGPPAAA
jgi:hypothetical protein